jgi:hypothetical protein
MRITAEVSAGTTEYALGALKQSNSQVILLYPVVFL